MKPVGNAPISQGFGANATWYKRLIGQKGHNGIDYAVPVGTPVKAVEAGTVAFEGWGQDNSWMGKPAGICAIIKHDNGHSGYAHLSRTVVDNGQRVKKGQVIGYSGATGKATGPHLHFETLPLSPNFKNGFAGRINPAGVKLAKPAPKKKSNDAIAREVLAGKWGNGVDRTNRLKKAGYNPTTIQGIVNRLSAPAQKFYTVKKGDTMSGIAVRHKTTLANLAKLNPSIRNLNVINVGQRVRVK